MNVLDRERPDAAIPQLEKRISQMEADLIDRVYPIGSYYFTSDYDFNPNSFGGRWELVNNTDPYKWHRTR